MPSTSAPKEPTKAILLKVPVSLLQKLDIAAKGLRYTRTALINRSLQRDFETTLRQEVFKQANHNREMVKEFGIWPPGRP